MSGMTSYNYGSSTGTKATDKSKNSGINSAAIHQSGLNFLAGLNDSESSTEQNCCLNPKTATQNKSNFLWTLYSHYQFGFGKNLTINASEIDLYGGTQRSFGISDLKVGAPARTINLFNTGVNESSLAFGKIDVINMGNNQYSIVPNRFDFEYRSEAVLQEI